jgi:hypothetical protein
MLRTGWVVVRRMGRTSPTPPGACPERPRRPITRQARGTESALRGRQEHLTRLPKQCDAQRMAAFLASHPGWSAFWDKRDGLWRVAEDDPSSDLYAADAEADRVIDYIATHRQPGTQA